MIIFFDYKASTYQFCHSGPLTVLLYPALTKNHVSSFTYITGKRFNNNILGTSTWVSQDCVTIKFLIEAMIV